MTENSQCGWCGKPIKAHLCTEHTMMLNIHTREEYERGRRAGIEAALRALTEDVGGSPERRIRALLDPA